MRALYLVLLPMLAASAVAPAQDAAGVTAEQAVEAAQEAYGPPDPRAKPECAAPQPGGEIVVCGQAEDPEKYRVRSSGDLDPTGKGAQGPPRAPDLFNLPQTPMVGVGVSAKGCFIPPCPSPMPLLIDLKAIPEAPPGSNADRVAQGLAPSGEPVAPLPLPAPDVTGAAPAPTPRAAAGPAEVPSG
ncbi:hypothetical protein [Parafrankia sp. BMG5.11]|uniref:hypothetical protein n=1 Tax=Parafrankia sp. BMG5.11 TaxID=222540 RepID=UPI00103CCB8D|nr:hypothetical protein [Parafrankia sp. BMG5.11]